MKWKKSSLLSLIEFVLWYNIYKHNISVKNWIEWMRIWVLDWMHSSHKMSDKKIKETTNYVIFLRYLMAITK